MSESEKENPETKIIHIGYNDFDIRKVEISIETPNEIIVVSPDMNVSE